MKLAICDDDRQLALDLQKKVKKIPFVTNTDIFTDFRLLEHLAEETFDVILMDIDWNGEKNGIDAAAELTAKGYPARIIFVTSYAEKFIQQIFLQQTNVAGFLMKPVEEDLLYQNLQQIYALQNRSDDRYLITKENGRQLTIPLADIVYVESKDHYMDIFTAERKYHVPETMATLESRLNTPLIRCHKGFIINMDHIKEYGSTKIRMDNNKEIPVGRRYSGEVKKRYLEYLSAKI